VRKKSSLAQRKFHDFFGQGKAIHAGGMILRNAETYLPNEEKKKNTEKVGKHCEDIGPDPSVKFIPHLEGLKNRNPPGDWKNPTVEGVERIARRRLRFLRDGL